jgi:hypothetical protein
VAYEARRRDEHPEIYRAAGRALVHQVNEIVSEGVGDGSFAAGPTIERARLELRLLFGQVLPALAHVELASAATYTQTTAVGGAKTVPIRYTFDY